MSVSGLTQGEDKAGPAGARRGPFLLVLAVLTLVGLVWFLLPLGDWLEAFALWVESLGAIGIVGFALAYAVTTILVIPGMPMTVAAGVAFGWWGIPLVLVSATAGSLAAFLASRYVFNRQIRDLARSRPRLRSAVEAVSDESWTVLALMRLSPVLPFNIQNYLLGLTDISLTSFFASTFTGMIPGAVLCVYLGVLGLDAGQGEGNFVKWTLLILGFAATIFGTMHISRRARAKLAGRLPG